MKILRFNENNIEEHEKIHQYDELQKERHLDLINLMYKKFNKDNKIINGFEYYEDDMTGTVEWSNDYYVIYATPYWDDNMYLPIDIANKSNNFELNEIIDLKLLRNEKELDNFIKFYYNKIYEITSELNLKTELIKDIELILKTTTIAINLVINNTYIKEIESIDDINVDILGDNEVKELHNILKEKYGYILMSNKFNL